MPLINCPECSREISDQAESCPHCGYPVARKRKEAEHPTEKNNGEDSINLDASPPSPTSSQTPAQTKPKKTFRIGAGGFLLIVVVLALIAGECTKKANKQAAVSSPPAVTSPSPDLLIYPKDKAAIIKKIEGALQADKIDQALKTCRLYKPTGDKDIVALYQETLDRKHLPQIEELEQGIPDTLPDLIAQYEELLGPIPDRPEHQQKLAEYKAQFERDKEQILLARAKVIPASDLEANKRAYFELSRLYPDNPTYKQKFESYRAKWSAAQAQAQRQAACNSADLQLLNWSWSKTGGGRYAEAEGEVKNISGHPLEYVKAVVSWYDANGQFISSDTSYIQYNPLLPGQRSPFRVMNTWNPAMRTARIEFSTRGQRLDTCYPE